MAGTPCTCLGDPTIDLLPGSNLNHLEGCPRYWLDLNCGTCGKRLDRDGSTPPCVVENGFAHCWCSDACADAWINDPAHPERKEGWIDLNELTPEQTNELLKDIGLELDGVGERKPS